MTTDQLLQLHKNLFIHASSLPNCVREPVKDQENCSPSITSKKETEVVSEGTSECNQSPLKNKKTTNKKPETSIFSLIQSSASVLTNNSPVCCFPWWQTVDAQRRPSEDASTGQYYPGTLSQVLDTTGATQVASFSSI